MCGVSSSRGIPRASEEARDRSTSAIELVLDCGSFAFAILVGQRRSCARLYNLHFGLESIGTGWFGSGVGAAVLTTAALRRITHADDSDGWASGDVAVVGASRSGRCACLKRRVPSRCKNLPGQARSMGAPESRRWCHRGGQPSRHPLETGEPCKWIVDRRHETPR